MNLQNDFPLQRSQSVQFGMVVLCGILVVGISLGRVRSSAHIAKKKPQELSAVGSQPVERQIAVHAARRGNPYINLSDGVDLLPAFVGDEARARALTESQAEPLALVSGDFDEDGVPDLVCGYASTEGGTIAMYRGNPDALYPYSLEAQQHRADGTFTDSPFLTPATIFAVASAPKFLGAGDFNADGHLDLVAAQLYGSRLELLAGNGHGRLSAVNPIPMAGQITTLMTGEINRADGLADIVVGIVARTITKYCISYNSLL